MRHAPVPGARATPSHWQPDLREPISQSDIKSKQKLRDGTLPGPLNLHQNLLETELITISQMSNWRLRGVTWFARGHTG